MLKKLLTVVLPLIAPFLVWWLYLLLARYGARKANEPDPPGWTRAPWLAMLISAVVLLAASLFWFHAHRGGEAWSDYQAPRLEDGEIVPSHIEPQG
ncbi:hypothetical protein [Aquibaculum sediminis]|uniref:hypothetical protein n=1 Tax=Aquibaculum sediminis TaxID=3231907 RepID=UPI003452E8A9